jgi:hypothetical protein
MRWMDYAVKPGSKPIAMRPSLQQCVRRIRISIAGILVRWSTRLGVFAAWVSPTNLRAGALWDFLDGIGC